jgi:hypothetical protein
MLFSYMLADIVLLDGPSILQPGPVATDAERVPCRTPTVNVAPSAQLLTTKQPTGVLFCAWDGFHVCFLSFGRFNQNKWQQRKPAVADKF